MDVKPKTLAFLAELFVRYIEDALDDPAFIKEETEEPPPLWWEKMVALSAELHLDFELILKDKGTDYEIRRLKYICGKGPQPSEDELRRHKNIGPMLVLSDEPLHKLTESVAYTVRFSQLKNATFKRVRQLVLEYELTDFKGSLVEKKELIEMILVHERKSHLLIDDTP